MHDDSKATIHLPRDNPWARLALLSPRDIGARLTMGFAIIVLLMLGGTATLVWRSHVMRTQANRLMEIDDQFIEVQRVHTVLLSFRVASEGLVKNRDLATLEREAPKVRSQLTESVAQTEALFGRIHPDNILDPTILPTLQAIQGRLPSQLEAFEALAKAGDWNAVQQRLTQQLGSLEDQSIELVDLVHEDVFSERAAAARRIHAAQVDAFHALLVMAVITVVIAGFLGVRITKSITGPLRSLMAGASALARGDFNHRVPVTGKDQLAHLGEVFNETIIELRDLYQELQSRETFLAEAQQLSQTGSFGWSVLGNQFFSSGETLRIFEHEAGTGPPTLEQLLAHVHAEDRAQLQEQIEQASREQQAFDSEFRVLLGDGSIRYVRVVAHRCQRQSREQFVGAAMNVTAGRLALEEIRTLKDQLFKENVALREEIDKISMFEEIVGSSDALRKILSDVARVAPTDSTVLIMGETGTGKELVARAIHRRSERSSRAFIRVNCAAIPQTLIASELFGHEKGAFTGAAQRRLGRFELADGGTIFLDEVGELPIETQVALLRVLQEREFERLGGTQPIAVNVRVLAATNRDLEAAVESGAFRQDLFYRLNVFPIQVPALRERADDIPLLLEYMIDRYSRQIGKRIRNIDKRTMDLFQSYAWPGNIRELQNVVERGVILCEGETFKIDEQWFRGEMSRIAVRSSANISTIARLEPDQERELIEAALRATQGRISGPSGAAARLGIPRQTLESKMARLGIQKHLYRMPDPPPQRFPGSSHSASV
jgi:transcriptional regulator with PAS, ATPase and Fis domain/HAMP domain-containing protein